MDKQTHNTNIVLEHTNRIAHIEGTNKVQTEILVRIEENLKKLDGKVHRLDSDIRNGYIERKVETVLARRFSREIKKYAFRIITGITIAVGAFILSQVLLNLFI